MKPQIHHPAVARVAPNPTNWRAMVPLGILGGLLAAISVSVSTATAGAPLVQEAASPAAVSELPPTDTAPSLVPVAAGTQSVPAAAEPTQPPILMRPRWAPPQQERVLPGPNQLNIPAIGIDARIRTVACGRLIPDGIWRWPCAGANNIYLLGHNWGIFHPLQVAYHAGLLKPGLVLMYSDQRAVIHHYRLAWARSLSMTEFGQGDAWAATAGPVITLQTCDGAGDSRRLIVRFVPD